MNSQLFWRAALVQAALVAVLFGVLLLLPLDEDFFEDYGFVVGPLAWLLCAGFTGRILRLPLNLTLFAAVAGGVAGTLVALVWTHLSGLVVAIAVFGASSAGYEEATRGEEQGSQ